MKGRESKELQAEGLAKNLKWERAWGMEELKTRNNWRSKSREAGEMDRSINSEQKAFLCIESKSIFL